MRGDVETIRFPSDDLELYGQLWRYADDAPTVVLLSGLGFHSFEYEPFAAELVTVGLNALSFDYRGHGHSPGRRGRWTLDELVSDCRHALDLARWRLRGPVALFGNSLGAMVALLAGARDARPFAVAAANCPARIGDFLLTPSRRALFALAKLVEPVAPLRISVNHFYAYEQLIDDASWVATIRRDPLITEARRLSVRCYRELLETWDGPTVAQQLHKPVLVIQGSDDRLQPPGQSRLVYDAAGQPKRYKLLDTGHLPHLQAPAKLAGLLADWVSDQRA